jgi:steroid delta-isomerase-like uncharacterized protein
MSQQLIDAAKAPTLAYGKKDWEAVKSSVSPDFTYDEVATNRKVKGDEFLACWKDWATTLPDSQATFNGSFVSGDTVVLEVTWHGTHKGPLQMPTGPIAATGKKIELRACQVVQIAGGKAQSMRHYYDMATLLQQLGVTK